MVERVDKVEVLIAKLSENSQVFFCLSKTIYYKVFVCKMLCFKSLLILDKLIFCIFSISLKAEKVIISTFLLMLCFLKQEQGW